MPPRLNKRQQRELEELEALKAKTEQLESESEVDEAPPIVKPAGGGFAAVSHSNCY